MYSGNRNSLRQGEASAVLWSGVSRCTGLGITNSHPSSLPLPSQKSAEMIGVKLYQTSVLQKHHTLFWQVTLEQQREAEMQNVPLPHPPPPKTFFSISTGHNPC